jgi:hypothetical protein
MERETGIEPATFSLGKWLSHFFTILCRKANALKWTQMESKDFLQRGKRGIEPSVDAGHWICSHQDRYRPRDMAELLAELQEALAAQW